MSLLSVAWAAAALSFAGPALPHQEAGARRRLFHPICAV